MTSYLNLYIKDGYISRESPAYFDDVFQSGTVYQPTVYKDAALEAYSDGYSGFLRVIDVGCGKAEKLLELNQFLPKNQCIGIDYGNNINFCRTLIKNPLSRKVLWVEHDLEIFDPDLLCFDHLYRNVLICSDVIEHLKNPVSLLGMLKIGLETSYCAVISTPERDLVYGTSHNGPPNNPHHVREWNIQEFRQLLQHFEFNIVKMSLTQSASDSEDKKTIYIVLQGMQQ